MRPPRPRGRTTSRVTRSVPRQHARLGWARQSYSANARPPRDWLQISVTAIPALAAVIALVFTSLSIRATDTQLQIAEQGQITDRYNAAIANLGSSSVDVRLGGIYALQRIMQDSPRDQSTIVAVLCAFVRDNSKPTTAKSARSPRVGVQTEGQTDVGAALTVVLTRNMARGSPPIDLSGADLRGMGLYEADLDGANLSDANLSGAYLSIADLNDSDLTGANLTGANLSGAQLHWVSFRGADLTGADLNEAELFHADLTRADLTNAHLSDANLSDANLTGANLTGVNLAHTDLTGANLTGTEGQ